jgi:hypothetical protein
MRSHPEAWVSKTLPHGGGLRASGEPPLQRRAACAPQKPHHCSSPGTSDRLADGRFQCRLAIAGVCRKSASGHERLPPITHSRLTRISGSSPQVFCLSSSRLLSTASRSHRPPPPPSARRRACLTCRSWANSPAGSATRCPGPAWGRSRPGCHRRHRGRNCRG